MPLLSALVRHPFWQSGGLLIGRLVIFGIFAMACFFKFKDMNSTAQVIAAVGFSVPLVLAWLAAILEVLLALAFLTGVFMREAALVALVYVLFLGFAFHGPRTWQANQMEFGFFIDHFTFAAGLLYMLATGPGPLALKR
jgi:uncharacterized membrane protein YphA (DoxX/SURF4 family)